MYSTELLRWNKSIKLTASPDIYDLAKNHIADALHLHTFLPSGPLKAIDVGSGGGLPAIILALIRRETSWTLIEPIQKKTAFLKHITRHLGLSNVTVLPMRFDKHIEQKSAYDLAISRALWPPHKWIIEGQKALRIGGTLIALEGDDKMELPESSTRHAYQIAQKSRSLICFVKS